MTGSPSARGVQLGPRAGAAGVLGHHDADGVRAHQRRVARDAVGAAVHDAGAEGRGFGIDKAQQETVGKGGERVQRLAPDGQEHVRRLRGQRGGGGGDVGHTGPAVARPPGPAGALQRQQGQAHCGTGRDGVRADPRGERVGRVDDMGDGVLAQPVRQPLRPAKAPGPGRQRQDDRRAGAPGIGIDRLDPRRGQRAGRLPRLGRAAQQQNAHRFPHHHGPHPAPAGRAGATDPADG